jgi:hypothetical protein
VEKVLQFCAARHAGEAVEPAPDSAAKKALLLQVGLVVCRGCGWKNAVKAPSLTRLCLLPCTVPPGSHLALLSRRLLWTPMPLVGRSLPRPSAWSWAVLMRGSLPQRRCPP